MKNIHLLPTDKPSRLRYNLSNVLVFTKEFCRNYGKQVNRNIYITSDEGIKDIRPYKGKWQLEKGQILNKFPNYLTDLSECKLVIMTTDQDLIKNGVQAIDDDFLEWYVKNPSCEYVDLIGLRKEKGYEFLEYEIIIPKEEQDYTALLKQVGTKQETLEEFAERLFPNKMEEYDIFLMGAKWQQEQNKNLYSEEDLWESYKASNTIFEDKIALRQEFEKWFEQFKKK